MNFLSKTRERYRDGLFLNTLYGQFKMDKIEVHLFYLFLKDLLDEADLDIQPQIEPLEVEILKPSDMKNLAAKAERDYSEDTMLQMLAEGCICIGLKYKDEIVSYGWVNLKKCKSKFFSYSFDLKENEAYAYGIRTMSAFKGKTLAPYQRYHTYKHLAQMGRTKIYSIGFFSNIPSIKFHRKLNAKPLKLFMNVNFLGKYKRNLLLKRYRHT